MVWRIRAAIVSNAAGLGACLKTPLATLAMAFGLRCLVVALSNLPTGEELRRVILRSPRHVLYVLRRGEACPIVGAVLHGKPGEALPPFMPPPLPAAPPANALKRSRAKRPSRKPIDERQLNFFAGWTG